MALYPSLQTVAARLQVDQPAKQMTGLTWPQGNPARRDGAGHQKKKKGKATPPASAPCPDSHVSPNACHHRGKAQTA